MRCTAEELIRKKTVIKISLNIVLEKKWEKRVLRHALISAEILILDLINLKEDVKEHEHD